MVQPMITVIGRVATMPKQNSTRTGKAVTTFRVAQTPRRRNPKTGSWEDGIPSFYGVTCWREWSENVVESFDKGDPVVVVGRLKLRPWDKDGRSGLHAEIDAISVGHDLRWGTTKYTKVVRVRAEDGDDDEEVAEWHREQAGELDEVEVGADPWEDAAAPPAETTQPGDRRAPLVEERARREPSTAVHDRAA